jgi:hypothetical protein
MYYLSQNIRIQCFAIKVKCLTRTVYHKTFSKSISFRNKESAFSVIIFICEVLVKKQAKKDKKQKILRQKLWEQGA